MQAKLKTRLFWIIFLIAFQSEAIAQPKPYQRALLEQPVSRLDLLLFDANLTLVDWAVWWSEELQKGEWVFDLQHSPAWLAEPNWRQINDFPEGYDKWRAEYVPDFTVGRSNFIYDAESYSFLQKINLNYRFPTPGYIGSDDDDSKFLQQLIAERASQGLLRQDRENFERLCRWMLYRMSLSHPLEFAYVDAQYKHWPVQSQLAESVKRDTSYLVEIFGSVSLSHSIFSDIREKTKDRFNPVVMLSCAKTNSASDDITVSYSGPWKMIEKIYTQQ